MSVASSATPLAQQLGLKPGIRCWFHNMPDSVRAAIDPESARVEERPTASDGLHCAHLFVLAQAQLAREVDALQPLFAPNGFLWVWWQNGTDLSEVAVREIAKLRNMEHVDSRTLDQGWTGLKLMIRKGLG